MNDKMERVRRLELWKRSSGMNWSEIAAKVGFKSGAFFSQMKSGERQLNEDVARKLERALGMPRNYLDGPTTEEKAAPMLLEVSAYIASLVAAGKLERAQLRRLIEIAYEDCVAKGRIDEPHIRALVELVAL